MKTKLQKIKRLIKQVLGRFETKLPVGVTEFEAWCDDIKVTYDLPTDRDDDIRTTFAAVIMRFDEIISKKPKYYFVRALRSGAAKQIANHVFTEIHTKHKAAAKAAQEAAQSAAAVDEPKIT